MFPALAIAALGYALTGGLLGTLAVLVLYACWLLLHRVAGPPVLFLALAYHWLHATLGVFYGPLTGRQLMGSTAAEYQTMVLIALGCVLALAAGIRLGIVYMSHFWPERSAPREIFSFRSLLIAYGVAFFVTGTLQGIAWNYPMFTQPMIASTTIRLGLFYFCVRRLVMPVVQPVPLIGLLAFEVVVGISGFFASFREPLLFAGIAFVEAFDRRRLSHWVGVTALLAVATAASIFWMGVRGQYRQDFAEVETFAESRSMRLQRLQQLGSEWSRQDWQELLWTVDFLVDRMWPIYYPALAVERVPKVLPHTDGDLIWRAVQHIAMPRVLFPDKRAPGSESELVRKYSGVHVAGEESGTSIAFGYAAESYVDFGLPVMFVPVLVWGIFLGMSYHFLRYLIRHDELRVPLLVVVFWMALSQFERSWAKTMGLTGTLLIYLGLFTYFIDRWLVQRYLSHQRPAAIPHLVTTPRSADAHQ
jgi:hypothetical protein